MVVYESINKIYLAVLNLINIARNWFTNINFSELIEFLPLQFQFTVIVLVSIIITLAIIGLIKKLSFLLG